MRHSELQKEIETPVLLARAIEDSTVIFGISGGGVELWLGFKPQTLLGTSMGLEKFILQTDIRNL